MKNRHAFTLVEMLVVITIIGIIAALVVNLNAGAQKAKREAAVKAELTKLKLMIDNYQLKLGYYPPDNATVYSGANVPLSGMIVGSNVTYAVYDAYAATNPLIYELTGATNNTAASYILCFDGTSNLSPVYNSFYGRTYVANANVDEPHNFFVPGPQTNKDYVAYTSNAPNMYGLTVPVYLTGPTNNNFWHYDASSPNRHNPGSYDLWAEYNVGVKGTNFINETNGNW
jgi:prepilin-type N-terminal cleavage/methylation domain-containing protein